VALLSALLVCCVTACVTTPAPRPGEGAAPSVNVILIVLDTVRADHLSCYGYPRRTTPELEWFARRATRYLRAQAPAPWTLPSHASLFTGLYPFEHHAHSVDVARPTREMRSDGLFTNVRPLAPEARTLAEVLRDRGYLTGAQVANVVFMTRKFGVAQGFEQYSALSGRAPLITRGAMHWLNRRARDPERRERPFFLFLNYMDAHAPYNTSPVPGLFDHEVPDDAMATIMQLYPKVLRPDRSAPPELIKLANEQYDLGVANADQGLGLLFRYLEEQGLFDSSLIVATSDHGEYLGEHDLIEHSKDVYQEALWVPLLIKRPGQRRGRDEPRLISLTHVPGLIMEVLGGENPFPHRWPAPVAYAENHFARVKDLEARWGYRFQRERFVIFRKHWKYIESTDGAHELYDLRRDPQELHDLREQYPRRAAALRRRLLRVLEAAPPAPTFVPRPIDEDEAERMRSLGYL
jgi:arylsulfatase A-like enzyme